MITIKMTFTPKVIKTVGKEAQNRWPANSKLEL